MLTNMPISNVIIHCGDWTFLRVDHTNRVEPQQSQVTTAHAQC